MFCGFPMLWFPCSSQPAALKTAWTIAFLPRVAAFPHRLPPLSLAPAKKDLTQKGRDEPNEHAVESGNPAPTFHKDIHVALDPGTAASFHGQSPRPATAGELPLVHSASLHENKTPACSRSAGRIIGRKL